ncbi:glycosyltransferase [Gluconacetobacter tumulisoli]|uniref:Glycosyltransferase n=2 Tax=Gluconacetobacter tumulisoli TaxID=1286189 RepID=A0A7W4PM80_9PROT|nr:glycosyltransferase [Gluconacetobacter tumulisoli]MBB2202703.1 glycosyltransferase [Gluconacetobacter tumulisoli]
MRAIALRDDLDRLTHLAWLRDRSASGRLLHLLRGVRALTLGRTPSGRPLRQAIARLRQHLRQEGAIRTTLRVTRRIRHALRSPPSDGDPTPVAPRDAYALTVRPGGLAPRILIVAELSLGQCAKYRVWQRVDQLRFLGWTCQVVDWRDTGPVLTALQFCTLVVFYRVPAFDSVQILLAEARRLSLPCWWEVDDLIFDRDLYLRNGNLATLPDAERAQLLFGVELFRNCMLACDRGIASTPVLAEAMRTAGLRDVSVIENALDADTLAIAAGLEAGTVRDADDRSVVVAYGSGTRTHDADFRVAVPGLVAAMAADTRLRLLIVGDLVVPGELAPFGDRVEILPARPYRDYLALLAQADVAIAPLVDCVFNDAKSNIKYLEAAVLGLPSVCSPRRAFADAIVDGQDGCLAATDDDWTRALLQLADDAGLRRRIGGCARAAVMDRYAPDHVAPRQVAPVFGRPAPFPRDGRLRVLCVNVYYPPRAFGGATRVVEEMVRRLRATGVEVAVLTSHPAIAGRPPSALRYQDRGVPVLSIDLPPDADGIAAFDNPAVAPVFADLVTAFRPDIVHVHAPQGLGIGMLRVCRERGIPYVVTLHDAWWLCDRQFMVRADGRFCGQARIDPRVCQRCRPQARYLDDRALLLGQGLRDAALLLSPSAAHRDLYIANGVDPARIVVNRNGFTWPPRPRPLRPPGLAPRFGYVGGTETVKGFPLIRAAFEGLDRSDWVLRLVDNKLNLGLRSIDVADWRVRGQLDIVAAYDAGTMDAFFDSIDVLLFPSRWPESYGLTVREALARDVWVVASAPGGQAEDIVDGVNGTLIGLDATPGDLAAAVAALLDPGLFDGYVNPFKDQLATWNVQARELLDLLHGVVGAGV